MKFTLTLAFVILLCTCGRAQNKQDKLPHDLSNVAFIKGGAGFLIDSLTIRTSLDTVPYGFAFREDTLVLDISIFSPVDELIVEAFAKGHSFKRYRCWIDGPSADVHLSIAAGRTVVDSVGLSPMDLWFRREVSNIHLSNDLAYIKGALKRSIVDNLELLMCANFIEAFQSLPNLERSDIFWLRSVLKYDVGRVKRHPWFAPLIARQELLESNLPRKLDKYELNDHLGKPVEVATPKNQYYVLNFYDARKMKCRQDHELLQESFLQDSIFTGVPFISVTKGDYLDGWLNYMREGSFSWPHYLETPPSNKPGLYEKMALSPASTYVLINERNQIEGVFEDLQKLVAAVLLRKRED
ncbi:hypothetical protein FUA23_17720 [Neolewinella aurantiaca]|uniref:Thioredoxin domain-containing protein n=1 Tax=Neolewinella aurantiaca TaxID=2602767 RepID=A0A5C7FCC0_9BACT|nr:hypothetical protein [Neolewinella aurantiaca]TXF87769.1 hypothetical protein FUA23_17720 [Neolewinella aurantiaca]